MTLMSDVTGFVTRTKWRRKMCREHLGKLKRNVDITTARDQLASENMECIV